MMRLSTKSALAVVAAAALSAGPATAQSLDLNYFWDYVDVGGQVVNQLNIISTADSFNAQLFAETVGSNPFQNTTGNMLPGGGATASFFNGGPQNPILIGGAPGIGGNAATPETVRLGGVIDATWISDWPGDVFPVGGIANPISAGQFTLNNTVDGQYTIRINNAVGPAVQINGTIVDGRFSQALLGDANLDGDVDVFQGGGQGDIQIVLANLGTGTRVFEGDVSGDGDVDVFQGGGQGDIQVVLANLGNTASSTRSAAATATYNRDTGELTYNIFGDVILVGVESIGNFDTGATPGNLTAVGGGVDVVPTQFDQDTLAYFFNAGINLDQGNFNVGSVLATGLTEADILFEYNDASGAVIDGLVIVVPEPGSMALLGLGGLALIRRRRAA